MNLESGPQGEAGDVLDARPPGFTSAEAETIAAQNFDHRGRASALASERDQNFLITNEVGKRAVLKISSAAEPTAVIEMEVEAALHAKRVDPGLPIALPWPTGDQGAGSYLSANVHLSGVEDGAGTRHQVRTYDFMDGKAAADPLSLGHDDLWEFGRITARLGLALRGFFHPAVGRELLWDVQHAPELRPLAKQIQDSARRALVSRVLDRFEERVAPRWSQLRILSGATTEDRFHLLDTCCGWE